jgi:hypothetical protein
MDTESILFNIATHLKENVQSRETALQSELLQLEARKAVIWADLRLAAKANGLLLGYQPGSAGDYKCPFCWMQRERGAALYSIGGGTRDADYYRCSECSTEITVRL